MQCIKSVQLTASNPCTHTAEASQYFVQTAVSRTLQQLFSRSDPNKICILQHDVKQTSHRPSGHHKAICSIVAIPSPRKTRQKSYTSYSASGRMRPVRCGMFAMIHRLLELTFSRREAGRTTMLDSGPVRLSQHCAKLSEADRTNPDPTSRVEWRRMRSHLRPSDTAPAPMKCRYARSFHAASIHVSTGPVLQLPNPLQSAADCVARSR